ncbi:MAG: RsmE family RNA methyltransferase [Chitinophagaceae bacterium]
MQLPYFYEPFIAANKNFVLSEETSKHCIIVLRMKQGQQLQLTDGKGNLFTAAISKADKKNCEVVIRDTGYEMRDTKQVCIAISLLKNANRFEWFLEKATEIGVEEIIPLLCERTEKQHFRFERMNNILISAMLQSRQAWLPFLKQPTLFHEVVTTSAFHKKFIAHCMQSEKKFIKDVEFDNNLQILIGPEGDFTINEIQLALQHNYIPVSLGSTRLRAETAGVVASALMINCT